MLLVLALVWGAGLGILAATPASPNWGAVGGFDEIDGRRDRCSVGVAHGGWPDILDRLALGQSEEAARDDLLAGFETG